MSVWAFPWWPFNHYYLCKCRHQYQLHIQDSPPAWTQEAYLSCPVPGGGGYPPFWLARGDPGRVPPLAGIPPCPDLVWGTPGPAGGTLGGCPLAGVPPIVTWPGGYPGQAPPGWGSPPSNWTWPGYPPPFRGVDRQTPVKIVPYRHTTYSVGK